MCVCFVLLSAANIWVKLISFTPEISSRLHFSEENLRGFVTWGKKEPAQGFTPFLSCLQATCDRSLTVRAYAAHIRIINIDSVFCKIRESRRKTLVPLSRFAILQESSHLRGSGDVNVALAKNISPTFFKFLHKVLWFHKRPFSVMQRGRVKESHRLKEAFPVLR